MKRFNVWSEGYIVTGNTAGALYHGEVEGADFEHACSKLFKHDDYFNRDTLSHWGCKLFDNEADARASFG